MYRVIYFQWIHEQIDIELHIKICWILWLMQFIKVLVILLRGKWNNCVFDFAIINISAISTVLFDIDHYLMHFFFSICWRSNQYARPQLRVDNDVFVSNWKSKSIFITITVIHKYIRIHARSTTQTNYFQCFTKKMR